MSSITPRPTALITGASSGIGADFARELARDGHDLILVARSVGGLQAVADECAKLGARTTIIPLDLGLADAGARLLAAVQEKGVSVDVLINNAGFGDAAPFHEADPARISGMINLNILALTDITRAFLPAMVARGHGRVLLVASTAAFQPGPSMAVYCATKAYVLSFGEAINYELKGTGVTVTTLCPGATKTNFASSAKAENNLLFSNALIGPMASNLVARLGYRALKRGHAVRVTGLFNKLTAWSGPLTPRWISLPLARMMMAGH